MDRNVMGENGYHILKENYLVEHTFNSIVRHVNKVEYGK